MTKQEGIEFIERYFAALRESKDKDLLSAFISEEPLFQHIAFFDAAFPGYWLDGQDTLVDGDKIAVRFDFHGTHKGELMGIAPTGKTVKFEGLILYELANGKIVNHWMQTDIVSLLQQLGAMPAA
jgi:predicted ester cyclase